MKNLSQTKTCKREEAGGQLKATESLKRDREKNEVGAKKLTRCRPSAPLSFLRHYHKTKASFHSWFPAKKRIKNQKIRARSE
jgi:hypothetical protein